ncbi:hypothetical protein JGH11_08085 [Dysgonomonas sp. Marseille-P4677]|uniref:DUF5715 family protein n=1 Tax=Dysgonomonas sp. Marseille-P4677 TaxID=2364790 RepID=UPI0019137230|nr:DUF5715 family protein [Dysgonomonas sp. Marseille-P4677]MBK5720830.1 hypothetical protein [Dysgonomonas sp. Marseille-P4677]
MKHIWILLMGILSMVSCGSKERNSDDNGNETGSIKKYTRFNGNYNKTFGDLQDLHIAAAMANGVGPLVSRADTALYEGKLIRIPNELSIYKIDRLKHSMPFLVPKAATLLSDICLNFRDSLISKKMAMYKPIITSITRTDDDVTGLSKRNRNASENSAHRYGTTFDIAWTRFEKIDSSDPRTLDDGRLKAILGQVLHDLRERDRCYIKHERKQSCFHITVR